jgi:hypothetical protein
VAKADGDSPNSDELKPLGDEPMPEEPVAEEPVAEYADLLSDDLLAGLDATGGKEASAAPADEFSADMPLPDEGILDALDDNVLDSLGADVAAEESKDEAAKEAVQPPKEKKAFKLPWYLDLAVAGAVALVLLGLAALHLFGFSTALYLIAIGLIPYGVWKGGAANSIYTMILACALAAVVTAAYLLWLELERYHLDIKAREGRQRVAMSPCPQFGPASTTATAWPAAVRLTSSAALFEDRMGSPQIT